MEYSVPGLAAGLAFSVVFAIIAFFLVSQARAHPMDLAEAIKLVVVIAQTIIEILNGPLGHMITGLL